jgi:hypothetical protein
MRLSKIKKNQLVVIKIIIITLVFSLISITREPIVLADINTNEEAMSFVENIFAIKSKATLSEDLESIESLYATDTKYGRWAYEYEQRKIKYISNWAEKQGVEFIDIIPKIVIKKSNIKADKCYFNILCNTEYKYVYSGQSEEINISKIGTYHSLQLTKGDGQWIISKEWYTDPFADSLSLESFKGDEIREYIKAQPPRDISGINERRKGVIEYAEKFCGAATVEKYNYKYNNKYRDFNSEGGDCANFASQALHEGGQFKETSGWNYDKGNATGPWVNAGKFTYYMINSGRASVIAKGSYEKVYKSSYKLLPGDFVAYEKKGDIMHVSVVTGVDSKGYSLVTCHNTDRNNVPWDLGWSDKKIQFWIIRVNY